MPITFKPADFGPAQAVAAAAGGAVDQYNKNVEHDLQQQDRYMRLAGLYLQDQQFRDNLNWQAQRQQEGFAQQERMQTAGFAHDTGRQEAQFGQQLRLQGIGAQNERDRMADQFAQATHMDLMHRGIPLSQQEQTDLARLDLNAGWLRSQLDNDQITPEEFAQGMTQIQPQQLRLQARQQNSTELQRRQSHQARQEAFNSSIIDVANPLAGTESPQMQRWGMQEQQPATIRMYQNPQNGQLTTLDHTIAEGRLTELQIRNMRAQVQNLESQTTNRGRISNDTVQHYAARIMQSLDDAIRHAAADPALQQRLQANYMTDYQNRLSAALQAHNQFTNQPSGGGGAGATPDQWATALQQAGRMQDPIARNNMVSEINAIRQMLGAVDDDFRRLPPHQQVAVRSALRRWAQQGIGFADQG